MNPWEKYREGRKSTQRLNCQKDDETYSGKKCRHPVHKYRHQMSVAKIRILKEEVSTPNINSHLKKIFKEEVSTPNVSS